MMCAARTSVTGWRGFSALRRITLCSGRRGMPSSAASMLTLGTRSSAVATDTARPPRTGAIWPATELAVETIR
jgi:hypothetical protein